MKISIIHGVSTCLLSVVISQAAHAALVDNGDGTITDTVSGLMWYQDANAFPQAWPDTATANAENLVYASYDDWRLPTIAEFQNLYSQLSVSGYFIPAPFLNMEIDNYTDWYWSSDTTGAPDNHPYYFKFDEGTSDFAQEGVSPSGYNSWGSWYIALGTLPVRDASTGYTVTVLGSAQTQYFGYDNAFDINNQGVVSRTYSFTAYTWDATNGSQTLGLGETRAINNNGDVVGYSQNASHENRAALWSGGVVQDLGTINNETSYALGINDSNIIVGRLGGSAGASNNTGYAIMWNAAGTLSQLQGLSSNPSAAKAISNNNLIVGESNNTQNYVRAVMWDANGSVTDLGTTGGYNSRAFDIDTSGTYVVGASEALPQVCNTWGCWYPTHPFVWDSAGGMVSLGDLSPQNDGNAWAAAVNASGVVVGGSTMGLYSTDFRGFIWQNGVMQDLNDLVPADPVWVITHGAAINDAGQIVALQKATDGSNSVRAVLLTP